MKIKAITKAITGFLSKFFTGLFAGKPDDFTQYKRKIFFVNVGFWGFSALFVYFLYAFVLFGNFANNMIAIFTNVFRMSPDTAYTLYCQIFRKNMELFWMLAVAVVFMLVFRIYLNWFVRYFRNINRGIDALLDDEAGEVMLAPELSSTERKLNSVKHMLVKRKLETQTAEQRKNDLIVYLAHDLKTPLASVIGYLNLLHDEKEISEELREKYLAISLEKAERLEDLVNEFFEIAKYNVSNITLQYSRINLTRLLEMLLYEFQPMLKDKNLTCHLQAAEDIMLKCDADKIQRVFDNLLKNAVLYGYAGTDIEIIVTPADEKITIRFINHGDVIPEEKLGRIFEQFYRLDSARGTSNGGAGLGLAIAKQIVELHGGSITAASSEEATCFTVELPVSKS